MTDFCWEKESSTIGGGVDKNGALGRGLRILYIRAPFGQERITLQCDENRKNMTGFLVREINDGNRVLAE